MTSQGTLLVATDFSAPARHAVERAWLLAAASKQELHILHALELDVLDSSLQEMLAGNLPAFKTALQEDAQQNLQALVDSLAGEAQVTARARVVLGPPLSVIAYEADALNPQLLILSARGASFLRHALLGSTAARLLRKSARRPVLVVKQPPRANYRKVLVAVDFSPVSLAAIRLARQVAPHAHLVLLHAFELPYEGKLAFAGVDEHTIRQYIATGSGARHGRLLDLAKQAGLDEASCTLHVMHDDPSQQIIATEQESDADLIVVGKHSSSLHEELLLGSVTKHVLAESQCDVLVICDPHVPDDDPQ